MSEKTEKQNKDKTENPPAKTTKPPQLAMTSAGFTPTNIDEAWRFANALARTNMVPQRYREKPDECLVALDLAARLKSNWLAVMQHTYDVKGTIGFEAKFVTALINRSGLYADPLQYEVRGEDVEDKDYAVRAFAKSNSTGTTLYGPWITWKLVKAEGWYDKPGSKWKTMPEQMFHYRAASWFKNRHCPEVAIGAITTEELEDMPPRKHVESKTFDEVQQATQEQIDSQMGSEQVNPEEPQPEPPAENPEPDKSKKKKKAAKKKKAKSEYICLKCKAAGKKHEFDKPLMSGVEGKKVPVCPECILPDIMTTEEYENTQNQQGDRPEFLEDD